jgi:hypothetical protein
MSQADIGRLPVVAPEDPTHILGYLGRSQVFEGYKRRLQEEQELEGGWRSRAIRSNHGQSNGHKV